MTSILTSAQATRAMRRARSVWTSVRCRTAIREARRERPVPVLSPEQYRFLRFLLDMADEVSGRGERSHGGPRERKGLHRIRAAVRLFEQSSTSPARTEHPE
jgi:hypothetical protein